MVSGTYPPEDLVHLMYERVSSPCRGRQCKLYGTLQPPPCAIRSRATTDSFPNNPCADDSSLSGTRGEREDVPSEREPDSPGRFGALPHFRPVANSVRPVDRKSTRLNSSHLGIS